LSAVRQLLGLIHLVDGAATCTDEFILRTSVLRILSALKRAGKGATSCAASTSCRRCFRPLLP